MNINKKEIIDEIISLEPELNNKREKLENILDDIVNIKPDIKVSSEFKNELKNKLLQRINSKSSIDLNNKTNYWKLFTSFVLWWVTVYSLIWIIWFNLNFEKIDEIESVKVQESKADINMLRTKASPPRPTPMRMEVESTMSVENVIMDSSVDSIGINSLYVELENYLKQVGISKEIIKEILEIVKKYN